MERHQTSMRLTRRGLLTAGVSWLAFGLAGCGCGGWLGRRRQPLSSFTRTPATLGTINDEFWQQQVENADASNFVIYVHEFQLNSVRLNTLGEDHIKQIAMRLSQGAPHPIIIERSMSSPKPTTKHHFPIHTNPDLDNQRREVVVKALIALDIKDAEDRVIVSKAYTQGISGEQGAQLYSRGFERTTSSGGAGGSFGGGFGGFGGGGGVGGFGGGGFF